MKTPLFALIGLVTLSTSSTRAQVIQEGRDSTCNHPLICVTPGVPGLPCRDDLHFSPLLNGHEIELPESIRQQARELFGRSSRAQIEGMGKQVRPEEFRQGTKRESPDSN